jgi:hypothetical protein
MTEETAPVPTPGDRSPDTSALAEPWAAEREGSSYRRLAEGVAEHLQGSVPRGALVLVVSRGDDSLLAVEGREVQHFPQTRTGLYAGYHPTDGGEAVAHLKDLERAGAKYFVVPATASWWLDYYVELGRHLESRGERIVDDPETCIVYSLRRRTETPSELTADEADAARTAPQVSGLLAELLPGSAGVLIVGRAARAVDVGSRPCWTLEPPDGHVAPAAVDVLAEAETARSAGARYLVLLKYDRPRDCLDARLQREVATRLRLICVQRLAEIYELEEALG